MARINDKVFVESYRKRPGGKMYFDVYFTVGRHQVRVAEVSEVSDALAYLAAVEILKKAAEL